MATIPVSNPQIPFMGLIPGGLYHGRMIRIKGFMLPYADRFNINLQCGPCNEPLDDVAFHLDVRPTEYSIVRNHYGYDGWGNEERHGGCPIQPGQPYEILILAQNDCYKVAINGSHFCEFAHRMPMNRVSYLFMDRDTTVNYIGLEGDVPGMGATAPGFVTVTSTPAQYGPGFSGPVINQPIHPGPYNPNVNLSYGAPPPYPGIPSAPYYGGQPPRRYNY